MTLRRFRKAAEQTPNRPLTVKQKRRRLQHELLEDRRLLAFGPALLGVDHNNGTLIQDGSIHNTAPRELTFRFDDGQVLDRSTLGAIKLLRSVDGVFDNGNDLVISPSFLDLGQNSFTVLMRFPQTLVDDLYRVEIAGTGVNRLKNTAGTAFGDTTNDGINNGANFALKFDLQLGAQIISVVPQPITRNPATGVLSQAKDKVEVYFNNDQLDTAKANNPAYYRLIDTQDQSLLFPQSVVYDAAQNKATLTFPSDLSTATFQLQIGSTEESNNIASKATDLGTISQQATAAVYTSEIRKDINGNAIPTAIPDVGSIISAISVLDSFQVSDLNVEVNIDHTWGPDLRVFLQSPAGQRVELIRDLGSDVRGGQIYGVKFDDRNSNGLRDTDEPGLSGWTIFVDSNANGELNPGERSTVTDSQGRYSFLNLALGQSYKLVEIPHAFFNPTAPKGGATTQLFATDFSNGSLQTLKITGNATKGTFQLGFSGRTTPAITFAGPTLGATTATNIQDAFKNLLDPGTTLTVTSISGKDFTLSFAVSGVGAPIDHPALVVVSNQLDAGLIEFSNTGDGSGFTSSGTNNLWHLSKGRGNSSGHTPENSFYFGQNESATVIGTYVDSANGTLRSPEIDLTDPAISGPVTLRLNHQLATEFGTDFAEIRVVVDGKAFVLLNTSDSTSGFQSLQFDLTPFLDQRIFLEFNFQSNTATNFEGWYVDDIRVEMQRAAQSVALGLGPQQQVVNNVNFGSHQQPVVGTDAFGYSAYLLNTPNTIYSADFESGSLGPEWTTFSSNATGRVLVSNTLGAPAHSGQFHLAMDTTDSGIYNLNEAVLTVNLSNGTDTFLSFWQKAVNDEDDALPATFTGRANGDGVSISADGITWHTLVSPFNSSLGVYTRYNFDLRAAAAAANIALGPNFRIKFQQYDNFPFTTDGRTFDDIVIADGVFSAVPRFEDISASITAKRVLQQFTDAGVARQLGGSGDEVVNGFTRDTAGNTYMSGSFQGTVDFDLGPATSSLTSAGGNDIFVAKYDANGGLLWARRAGGVSSDLATAVAVDSSGNVVVSGSYSQTADIGGTNLVSNGSTDAFVWKLTNAGSTVWAKGIGGTAIDSANGIDVTASGQVVATGFFSGTVDFDPGAGVLNQTSVGGTDAFVLLLNSAGNLVWARQMGGTGADSGEDVNVTPAGNITTTGSFNGTVDFNPAAGPTNVTNLTSVGSADGFVQQLTSAGIFRWASRFGSAATTDSGRDVTSDTLGNVFVTGNDNGDIFVQKQDPLGVTTWTKNFGAASTDTGEAIQVLADGTVLVAGSFRTTVNFGGGNKIAVGGSDAFLLKLDSLGNYKTVTTFGGTLDDSALGVQVEDADSLLVAGIFRGTATFDVGSSTATLTSNGGSDGFLAKVATVVGLDDGSVQLTPADLNGFQFDFYGNKYTGLFFSTNGLISFGAANNSSANTDLLGLPNEPTIAAFWEDLRTGSAEAEAVFWEVLGTGIDQRLVIQWSNVRLSNANGAAVGPLDFEAVLYERDGSIRLNYRKVADPQAVPVGPEQSVGTFVKGSQVQPSIASDSVGNYVVVWNSPNQDGDGNSVYGRLYNAAGTALGTEFLINETTALSQGLPNVAMNSSGRFVVTWNGNGVGDADGVFARIYTAAGVAVTGEFLVNQDPTGIQLNGQAGIDTAGNVVISWDGQGPADTVGVYARRFNSAGQPLGSVDEVQRIRFLGPPVNGSSFTLFRAGVETALIPYANNANNTATAIRDALRALPNTDPTLTVTALPTLNEVQTLTFTGNPASGTFELEFDRLATAAIPFLGVGFGPQTAANIQAALVALVNIGAGNVTVVPVGASDTQFRVTFVGALAGTDQPLLALGTNLLNQGSMNSVETVAGSTSGRDFEVRFLGTDGGKNQPLLSQGVNQSGVTHMQFSTRQDGANGEISVNNFLTGNQQGSRLDVLPTGAFTISWSSDAQDGNLQGVFAKRFDVNGVAIQPEVDELQRITLNGPPNLNSIFRLRMGGVGAPTTGNITYAGPNSGSQTAARIQTALRALPNLSTVTVTPGPGTSNEIQRLTFTNPTPGAGTFRLSHRGLITGPITFAGPLPADAPTTATNIQDALRLLPNITPDLITVVPVVILGVNQPFQFNVTFAPGANSSGIDHPLLVFVNNLLNQGGMIISTIDDGGKSPNEFIVAFGGNSGRTDQPNIELALNTGGVPSILTEELVRGVKSEFQVNVETTGDQIARDTVIRPDGSYFMVWQSNGQDGDLNGVFGKLYNAVGDVLRDEFQINTFTQGNQGQPRAGVDSLGNLIVTWRSDLQDGSLGGIYARRFGADAFPLGDEFAVNSLTAGEQTAPSISVNPNGTFTIAWSSAAGAGGIHAQQFAANTTKIGGEVQVSQFGVRSQTAVEVAQSANGNYVVVWQESGRDLDISIGIYAQLFNASGTALTGEFQVAEVTKDSQVQASVDMDNLGRFVIVWRSFDVVVQNGVNVTVATVRGRRFAANGSPISSEFQINTTPIANPFPTDTFQAPDIDIDPSSGNWVVIWGNTNKFYARKYDSNGVPTTPEIQLQGAAAIDFPYGTGRVALESSGAFTMVWNIVDNARFLDEVVARRFDASGNPTTKVVIVGNRPPSESGFDYDSPDIAINSTGIYTIVWQTLDFQGANTDEDVMLRRFDAGLIPLGNAIRVNDDSTSTNTQYEFFPRIAMAADNSFTVTWTERLRAKGILAQRFDANANLLGKNVLISANTAGAQDSPVVVSANNGNFAVAWRDSRAGQGIFLKSFTTDTSSVGIKAAGAQSVGGNVLRISVDGSRTALVGANTSTRIVRIQQPHGRLFAVDGATNRLLELESVSGATLKSYPLPAAAGTDAGLAYAGGTVYYIPSNGSALYELDPDTGGTVDVMPLSGISASGLSGLAYLNGEVVLLDATANKLIFIDPFRNIEVRRVTPAVTLAGGLVGGGSRGTLFAVNALSQIVELNATNGSVVRTIASPGANLVGLALVDNVLLASNKTGLVYRINPTSGAVLGTLTVPTGLAALGADAGGTLAAAVGGDYQPFVNTILDDEATLSITQGVGPFTGRYRPVVPLSSFDGTNVRGSWRLEIQDTKSGNTGVLNSWRLRVNETQDTPPDVQHVGFIGDNIDRTVASTNDVDIYKFNVLTGGSIKIDAKPVAGLNLAIRLFDAAGIELTRVDATGVGGAEQLNYLAGSSGVYFVGISSSGNTAYNIVSGSGATGGVSTGSYSLGIRFDKPIASNDDNSSFDTAIPIGAISVGGQVIRAEIRSGPYGPTLPGGNDEPGHRDIPPESHLGSAGASGYSPSQFILRFQDGVSPQRQAEILLDQGLQVIKSFDFIKAKLVRTKPGTDVIAKTSQLGQLAEIRYANPDYVNKVEAIPNDPLFVQQWHYDNQGQTGGTIDADIDLPEAWDTTTGSNQTVIAIIDTGVDYTHPDLAANMWRNPGEIAGDGLDNDGNGYVDDIFGIDPGEGDTNPFDNFGHGTHVAGTTAAVGNNGIGVTGVNWNAKIMAIKASNAGGGLPTSAIIEGLNYLVTMKTVYGINIVVSNNSYGGASFSQAQMDAIAASIGAGVVFVASAGNDSNNNDVSPAFPASYPLTGIISVAATDDRDQLASFSNFGPTTVDVAAPGVNVLSTTLGGGYGLNSGTSMASPHVAGVVALLAGFSPNATVDQLVSAILLGADPKSNLTGTSVSGARLNAAKSLSLLGTGSNGPTGSAITTAYYNFQDVYGVLPSGATAVNAITEIQKLRSREIFEMYSQKLGIQFIETANEGLTVVTGDLRAIDPTVIGGPGGVAGISEGNLFGRVIMDAAENWGNSEYGGSWFQTAMHEIGHSLGLGHAYDLPNLTIMGGFGTGEPVFPGDHDLVHGKYLFKPGSIDQDLYKFTLNEDGMLSAETIAERLAPNSSLLNTVISIYREVGVGRRELIASNDDYYSNDSYLNLHLTRGTYYVDISASGNTGMDPAISDTGFGGTSQGDYELVLSFKPDISSTIVDTDGVALDGNSDGTPGGNFNFYFETGPTIFVDKMNDTTPGVDGNGSLASPLDNIFAATELARSTLVMPRDGGAQVIDGESFVISDLQNRTVRFEFDNSGAVSVGSVAVVFTTNMNGASLAGAVAAAVDSARTANPVKLNVTPRIVGAMVRLAGTALVDASGSSSLLRSPSLIRILGNGGVDGNTLTLGDNRPYVLGLDGTVPLRDGTSLQVPQGVTVMVDAGALFKLRAANFDVGTSAVGVDRRQAALQILGTPRDQVSFYSYRNDTVGGDSDGPGAAPSSGDWGGLVFRDDSDKEASGIFLNWVNNATLDSGGGKLLVNSVESTFTPIHMISARPSVSNNTIRKSADAAISADPASFSDVDQRIGPDIHGNLIIDNSINGLFVRIDTNLGSTINKITVPSRWDDTDIVHVLTENLLISATPGGPQKDPITGVIRARLDGRLTIDPGVVVKLGGARIEVQLGGQLIAEGTAADPIIFTTLTNDSYGGSGSFDTKNDLNATTPAPGQWGGLFFSATSKGSLDHALINYAGGLTPIEGGFDRFNAIEVHQADFRLTNSIVKDNASGVSSTSRNGRGTNAAAAVFVRGAQPIIVNNLFQNNAGTVIHINANALQSVRLPDYGRTTGLKDSYNEFADNFGPLIRLNRLQNNTFNGMEVRAAVLTTETVWDDTDIAHILRGEISVLNHHTFSGLHLLSSASESLVVKLAGANAGFTANGTLLDIDDRIGGSIYIGERGLPVVLTSLADDTAIAGVDLFGLPLGDTNNDGSSTGSPGAWRSVLLDRFSNDRNVGLARESEPAFSGLLDTNRIPADAEFLGNLAPDEKSGDADRRLGFEVYGNISVDNSRDVDVYSFKGVAGTETYFDLDQTGASLDSVVELIDATGTVLARSINSTVKGLSGLAFPLLKAAYLGRDFYSINDRDAGMRVVLPGIAGQTNTYFVRVRSNPISTDVENINAGLTRGEYKLQIRLRQVDEKPGSFIRNADIRFATNGIQVIGLPGHSPLIGESVETRAGNDSLGAAQPLGNLLTSDRNTISVGGDISNPADVDWYRFELDYDLIQSIAGYNNGGKTFATIFDIDYADGLARPDTVLSVFDANGNLVMVSRDSNVADDQPKPGQGANTNDLARGSFGTQDAFIGSVQMPAGVPGTTTTYYVAVSSNSQLPTALNGTFTGAASNTLVRLEPINSLKRIAEDHIGFQGYTSGNFVFPVPVPPKTNLFDISSSISLAANVVPFTLNDIALYTATPGTNGLKTVNPFSGTAWTNVGNLPTTGPGRIVGDIAMRSDGRLFSVEGLAAGANNTAGQLVELDPGTGAVISVIGTDSIPDFDPATAPPNLEQLTSSNIDAFAWNRTDVATYDLYYSIRGARRGAGQTNVSSTLYRANPANGSAAVVAGQPWGRQGEIFQTTPGDLGHTTGMAFVGGQLFGVSDTGKFYTISLFSGLASNVIDLGTPLQGLAQGPQNAEGGRYANLLFALASDGRIFALSTAGVLQSVFSAGTSASTGNPSSIGLAFSTADFNLWHPTFERRTDAGHGINPAFDNSRTPLPFTNLIGSNTDLRTSNEAQGGASFRFGLSPWIANPVNSYVTYGPNAQLGVLSENAHRDLSANPQIVNNYNLPAGAIGSLKTNTVSLSGYASADKPTLYFNYFLETDDINTNGVIVSKGSTLMRDSARVLVSRDNGLTWELLATNNSVLSTAAITSELPRFISPNIEASLHPRQQVQELFDNTGGWRQARVDLSNYAGVAQLQFRFDFSTAAAIIGPNGTQLSGDQSSLGSLFSNLRGQSNNFEGFYIDDLIVGFSERGELVTGPTAQTQYFTIPQNPNPADPSQILVGQYQLELRRGSEYGANIDNLNPNIYVYQTFDTNDRLVQSLFRLGDSNLHREQGQLLIANNTVSDSLEFGILVDAGARDAGGSLSRPGGVRNLPTINNERLTVGTKIENNVVANFGLGGIRFSGDPDTGTLPLSSVAFGRILNNTIFGGSTARGFGIEVSENASPTVLNNVIANTAIALSIDASSATTIVGANLFKGNTINGTIGQNALLLQPNDPLFVNAANGNFYPAVGSLAIDSSINSLADRANFAAVNSPLGIPPSPVLAPERDRFGQLRLDDPAQNPPPGLGSNIFKDRGAVERADFRGPTAQLIDPLDNDGLGLDLNPIANEVLVKPTIISQIVIQLLDQGIGIDDLSVTAAKVQVFLDGQLLVSGIDYEFVYNATNNLIILRALKNNGPVSNRYEVILANQPTDIRDLAGNSLSGNQPSGQTKFVIITGGTTANQSIPDFSIATTQINALEDNEQELGVVRTTIPNFAGNLPPVPGLGEPAIVFAVVSITNAANFSVSPAINVTTGTLTFNTAPDRVGSSVVVMRLTEVGISNPRQSTSKTFTISLAPVNDAPVFTLPTTLDVFEDQGLVSISAFAAGFGPGPATAIDEAAQKLTITTTALNPAAFTLLPTIDATGRLQFRTRPDFNSSISNLVVTVSAVDDGSSVAPNKNQSPTKTFTINVIPVNDPPTFTLTQTQINVVEDEEDFRGIPQSEFVGMATNITVGPATALDEVSQTRTFVLTAARPELFSQQPAIDANGKLTFKTAPNRSGNTLVFAELQDSGPSSPPPNQNTSTRVTFTVSISPINDPPEFTIPGTYTVQEDAGLVTQANLATNIRRGPATAIDESNQLVSFELVALDPTAFVIQPAMEVDGTITFQTAQDVNSSNKDLRVKIRLTDNGISAPPPNSNQSAFQTLTLFVNPVNDAPVPDAAKISAVEDTSITIQSAIILLGDVPGPTIDELGQSLRITQVEGTTARGGIIVANFSGSTITSMTYTPPSDLVGEDTFLYVVTDDGSPNRSGTGTVTLLVAPINDPPQFNPGSNVVSPEDAGVVSTPWARDILAGPTRAIDENFGTTKQTVSFELSSNNPSLFTAQPSIDAAGILTFTSAPDASGSAVVTVVAVDSGSGTAPNINRSTAATFTIQVTPVNDPPAFVAGGNVTVNEDSAAYNQPWASKIVPAAGLSLVPPRATDESAQIVRFEVSNNKPSLFAIAPTIDSSGNLRFTPAADAQGSALVVVKAVDNGLSDGLNRNESVPVTFTFSINPTNDAPVGTDDRFEGNEDTVLTINAPGVLANDNDVDLPLDELVAVLNGSTSTLGAPVTLNANGSFTYDPTNVQVLQRLVDGDKLSDTFTYRVRDKAGSTSNLVTVSIVVNGVNDAPVAVNDRFAITAGQVSLLPVLANDRDVDTPLDVRTVEIGQLTVNGTIRVLNTGRVEYTPNAGFSGTDSFTYRVRDSLGAQSNEATVQVVTNAAPIALPDSASTLINKPIVIDVLRNDSDPDGTLNRNSISIVSGPDIGTAVVQADGTLLFTPLTGFVGSASLQYTVLDNEGISSNAATVTVQVLNSMHQNPSNKLDVDGDGFVSPIDVLILINDLNANGSRVLPTSAAVPPYLDVNGNRSVDPLDVLEVINFINIRGNAGAGGEGESSMALLGYSQKDVMMISTAEMTKAIQNVERKSLITRQFDAAVSDFSNSSVYGPSQATSNDHETGGEDTLESYLASWTTIKNEKSASDLDSVFSDEFWM